AALHPARSDDCHVQRRDLRHRFGDRRARLVQQPALSRRHRACDPNQFRLRRPRRHSRAADAPPRRRRPCSIILRLRHLRHRHRWLSRFPWFGDDYTFELKRCGAAHISVMSLIHQCRDDPGGARIRSCTSKQLERRLMTRSKLLAVSAAFSLLALGACAQQASTTTEEPRQAAEVVAPSGTIVDAAIASPDHTTLVTAVQAAGLVETLSGPGPFTVFAPTNAAFAKLPAGTVESL